MRAVTVTVVARKVLKIDCLITEIDSLATRIKVPEWIYMAKMIKGTLERKAVEDCLVFVKIGHIDIIAIALKTRITKTRMITVVRKEMMKYLPTVKNKDLARRMQRPRTGTMTP